MGSSSIITRIPEEAREFVRADESASLALQPVGMMSNFFHEHQAANFVLADRIAGRVACVA